MEILEKNDTNLRIIVRDADVPLMNALRRLALAEVPCMAIEEVVMIENSSILQDEIIAHRLGLTPLKTDLDALKEKSKDFGIAFEHWIFHELKTYIDYQAAHLSLSYWRSTSNFEVDFILGKETAIEVKASRTIGQKDIRGLMALAEENRLKRYIVVCLEEKARLVDDKFLVLPWQDFLKRLWNGELNDNPEPI